MLVPGTHTFSQLTYCRDLFQFLHFFNCFQLLNRSNQNKKKNNKQRNKSRSRSPAQKGARGKQTNANDNGGKGQQNISILQRDSQANEAPAQVPTVSPPGMIPVAGQESAVTSNDVSKEALAVQFKQQEVMISKEIERVVKAELNSTLMPMIDQKVRECVTKSVEPVLSTLNSLGKDGVHVDNEKLANTVASKVDEPLRAAFAENMKIVLIPAFENVSGQMFAQISSSLEQGMVRKEATANKELQDVKMQLSNMFTLVQQLTSEVQKLRSVVAEQAMRGPAVVEANFASIQAPPPPRVDQKQQLEQEVLSLLRKRDYDGAFTRALSASTVEMALFVCKNADLSDVMGGSSPALSQPILLCLMHQLGTRVLTANNENDLQVELAWLQEISLSINPADESMRRHLPSVLQQLVNGINAKMSRGDQPEMRRPLQRLLQVLRGMQV